MMADRFMIDRRRKAAIQNAAILADRARRATARLSCAQMLDSVAVARVGEAMAAMIEVRTALHLMVDAFGLDESLSGDECGRPRTATRSGVIRW